MFLRPKVRVISEKNAANTVIHDFIDAVERQACIDDGRCRAEKIVGNKVIPIDSFGQCPKFMVLKVHHDVNEFDGADTLFRIIKNGLEIKTSSRHPNNFLNQIILTDPQADGWVVTKCGSNFISTV